MFGKLFVTIMVIMAIYYGLYRFTGDYRYLSDGESISAFPEETRFNIPIVSGKYEQDWLVIERPDVGIRTVTFAGESRDKITAAKNCGRLLVELDGARQATFHKSGCFLDW
jgi:hypothetical protein